jgi:hypothetical protein
MQFHRCPFGAMKGRPNFGPKDLRQIFGAWVVDFLKGQSVSIVF